MQGVAGRVHLGGREHAGGWQREYLESPSTRMHSRDNNQGTMHHLLSHTRDKNVAVSAIVYMVALML